MNDIKIERPINPAYCATVVEIKNIIPLAGCDNVVGTNIYGYQAIVSKDTKIGDIGIVFTAETQLSDEFCRMNNLYRHTTFNLDKGAKGYIEDNRRIKAIKFRGHTSNCLFMPLTSLAYIPETLGNTLKVGSEFDFIGDHEICRKYVIYTKAMGASYKPEEAGFIRVEKKYMPEHVSSSNYFKYKDMFAKGDEVVVTQKLHGTSVRIGHIIVHPEPSLKTKITNWILRKIGYSVYNDEYDYVYGSRKVIKDINNPNQNHYYESDIWTKKGKEFDGMIPKGYILFGEIIGWTEGGSPIQKGYTYNLPRGESQVYIYRVAHVNIDGVLVDLSWEQVKEFCNHSGFKHVPELWKGKVQKFDADKYMNIRYFEEGYKNCVKLGTDESIVDEGVCIRKEGLIPTIMKAKCSKFLEHETKILDEGTADLESVGSEEELIINPNIA